MQVYFDNSATTPMADQVRKAIHKAELIYGNPATIYKAGTEASELVLIAREQVSNLLGATPPQIYFTSGGTESDNWALLGRLYKCQRGHILTTNIEHHAITHTLEWASKNLPLTFSELPVDKKGFISPSSLEEEIKRHPDTILVSIMYANNEIGTIQDISELSSISHKYEIPFHTDAVQAVGKIPTCVDELNVDLLSLSAHKFHGPKGVGALYIKDPEIISPLIHGGGQELGMRAGTTNVQAIVGLGAAAELALNRMEYIEEHCSTIASQFTVGVLKRIPRVYFNGSQERKIHCTENICFSGVDANKAIERLSERGIYISSGSACNCTNPEPSHVLKAIGLSDEEAFSSLRFSFSVYNTFEEVSYALAHLEDVVEELRSEN